MVDQTAPHPLQTEYVVLRDDAAGLDGVIAIHSTVLGPGAGGCRLWRYPDLASATMDAARLAEGMTYKNALAGLPFGGAKAVLRMPDGPFDREALFRAFGRTVEQLRGRYVTAEDVGTSVADMECVARETVHVAGRHTDDGRPGGDPSPWTARGVFVAMQAAAERHLGRSLADCTVAIQGVGNVGGALAGMLHAAGARLVVADIDSATAARVAVATGAMATSTERLLLADADILAPCALGGVLNQRSIPGIKAKLVCGAANNQLDTARDGKRLADRGILYAPDYVVNAGGIINVAAEYLGWTTEEVLRRVDATGARLLHVFDRADRDGLPTNIAADALAREAVNRASPADALAA